MAFKIALANVPFDLEYDENIRFESREKQYKYFNIPSIFANALDVNFHINDGLSAECYIVNADNMYATLNKNYAIIADDIDTNVRYLFYFIRRAIHDSSRKQYKLELVLDVINTYYLDCIFDDCLIQRAHLRRLKRFYSDNAFTFDYTKNSKLFKDEKLNIAFNIYNTKYNTHILTGLTNNIDKWFYDNVDYFIYYFIRKNNFTTDFYHTTGNRTIGFQLNPQPTDYNGMGQPYIVLCAPHYKTNKVAYIPMSYDYSIIDSRRQHKWSIESVVELIENKNLSDDVISIKISKVNPLAYFNDTFIGTIDDDNNLSISPSSQSLPDDPVIQTRPYYSLFISYYTESNIQLGAILYNPYYGLKELTLAYIKNNSLQSVYDTGLIAYSKAEIRANYIEPKVNIIANRIRIDNGISKYDIDRTIYNYQFIRFYYYEAIVPDITRIYIECRPHSLPLDENDDKIYNNEKLYVGFNCSIDLSIPYGKEQYDLFIANNKNFYMQRDLKAQLMLGKTVGNMIGNYPNMGGVMASGARGLMDTMYFAINSDYAIDNLLNAPPDIYNLNGNPFLLSGYNALNIYICEVSALNADIKTMTEYFKIYGYTYGELDNIKNIDNIRKYFNFVKAPIRGVRLNNGSLSNIIREKIKSIFDKGIIFYNYKSIEDTQGVLFDYNVNNYENEVDDG